MRIEIRSDSVLLDGYVNAVDRESRILPSPRGRFKERILPKTFEKALMRGSNVFLLFNHQKDKVLGSTAEKNLELREDNIGLRATAVITDAEIMELARSGQLRGWSFGFSVISDEWKDGEDGIQRRAISDLDLFEVSILTKTPAYLATSIEARGEDSIISEQRTEEFSATVTDNSEEKAETNQVEDEKTDEIVDEQVEKPDFSAIDHEIDILKLKGSL